MLSASNITPLSLCSLLAAFPELKTVETGSKNSLTGLLGIIAKTTPPIATLWFLHSCFPVGIQEVETYILFICLKHTLHNVGGHPNFAEFRVAAAGSAAEPSAGHHSIESSVSG